MNWREFFRPTISKIIFFPILYLVFPLPSLVLATCGGGSYWRLSFFVGFRLIYNIFTPDYYIYDVAYYHPIKLIEILFIISILIASYLLSCFIVFIYKRYLAL
jgi:hypothetical protein